MNDEEVLTELDKIGGDSERDYIPRSVPIAILTFIKSSIHKDFIGELNVRIEDMRDSLESANSKDFHETQGAIKTARQTLKLFVDLYHNACEGRTSEPDEIERRSIV